MDKIVVTAGDIVEVRDEPGQTPRIEPKLAPAIPWWARFSLVPLVLLLPLLCLIAIILRVAFRTSPPRTRHAWTTYLSTLLIVSGFLTSAAAVLTFSFAPIPAIVSSGLTELDERTSYPELPSKAVLSGSDAAQQLKTLVTVISPQAATFFGTRQTPSDTFGAGMLLQANSAGYLIATARHVAGEGRFNLQKQNKHVLVAMASGVWSGADVIASNMNVDLALLWLPRHSGQADFVQPIADANEGEPIFVIGHPEGLRFTLSTGIVSRMDSGVLQISAPISPGNSGGPVYDDRGNLIGIVSSTMDKSINPNAENLNFAVTAQALLQESGWEFASGGLGKFQDFVRASLAIEKRVQRTMYPSPLLPSKLQTGLVNHAHD